MSFLKAAHDRAKALPATDRTRVVLEYLLQHGVGRANAVKWKVLSAYLEAKGVPMSQIVFQHTILAASRSSSSDYFIASSRLGYFLIETPDDAIAMRDWYQDRIAQETSNLSNLIKQAQAQGWTL